MTQYIQGPSKGKGDMIERAGGRRIPYPPEVIPSGPDTLVCVVDNGAFEAAGVVDSMRDLTDFGRASDTRPKEWFLLSPSVLCLFVGDAA